MKTRSRPFIVILGIAALVLSIASIFAFNFNFGIIIIIGISLVITIYGLFFEKLIKIKLLNYSIIAMCSVAMIFMLFIYFSGKNDNVTFKEDVVIVHGASVRGERVSRILIHRLDKAVEYHQNNPDAIIIVSGGQGPQEDISEAEAMERYLISKGIPKEIIIKESASTSTYENLLFSKEILDEIFEGSYHTVLITNDFHIFRATRLAKNLGYNATHYKAKTDWYSIPMNYSRECLAIIKMWILKR